VLTIVPSDGRCEGIFDLTLDELRDLAGNGGARPITIFDVGWTFGPTRAYPGARVLDPDPRPRELTRDIMGERETLPDPVGRCFICSSSIRLSFYSDLSDVEAWGPSLVDDAETAVHGDLTRALVDALLTSAPEQLTLGQLVHRAHLAPRERADELVFAPAREDLLARLLAIRLQPVRDAVAIFHDWIGRPGAIEQGAYYYLGLAHFVLGEQKAAIRALRKERELGAEGGARAADVAYYLGRAYLAHGELAAAVSELEAATRADLESIPAHYYLGEAIRQLVLKQTLVQAQAAFERYLEHGAPHGRADEVEAQIEVWRRQREAEPETR
jgi:hypothetical protein